MKQSETKIKLFALLKQDSNLKLQRYVQEWNTPISTLRRWKKEFEKADTDEKLVSLVDVDEAIIEEAVNIVIDDITEAPTLEVEIVDGDFEDIEDVEAEDVTDELENAKTLEQYRAMKTQKFKDALTGLKMLNEETQATAGTILGAIADRLEELESVSANFKTSEIESLTNSLVNIQNAFFNKPTTNIQVNQFPAGSGDEAQDPLTAFRKRLTS